jgi:hypothetical protein
MGKRYRRAKRQMRLDRVAARFISGGKHNSFSGIAKAVTGVAKPKPVARMTEANHQRLIAGKKPTAKKTPARRTAAKKPSVYEAAKAIPAQNRAAGAAAAKKAAAPRAAKKAAPVRLANGQFDGREAMNPRDREQFERIEARAGVPEQQMRPLVRRRRT